MKRPFLAILLLASLPISSFAQKLLELSMPQDYRPACWAVRDSAELKPVRDEYRQLIETRFWPLRTNDITNIFGPRLDRRRIMPENPMPTNAILPLFVHTPLGLSGLLMGDDLSHVDTYAVGSIGYLEFFYYRDGTSLEDVAFYTRIDEAFVPLKTTNDLQRRMVWDRKKLTEFEQWQDQHMPKLIDLGVVKLSDSEETRVDLGGNSACLIATRVVVPPGMTNFWCTLDFTKDTPLAQEREMTPQHRNVTRTNQVVGFSMDGKYYRFMPKLAQ